MIAEEGESAPEVSLSVRWRPNLRQSVGHLHRFWIVSASNGMRKARCDRVAPPFRSIEDHSP
ncbi:hypothetical protein MESS2_980049 [Mesorhizobium metallidurans STM 2683]|uniref:Uncharacterized protein n=2 Tax=Mesorhizobium TaxID=68287 RepID=A0A1R3V7T8_9HYPH|nr:hypothetical protein MESS2_980049 [Mesorhizobium metallidurans STM 2683]SIT55960.1 conserved hypothetical protein [Mesorhizobium prunaredense]